jgi:hypothetical protein
MSSTRPKGRRKTYLEKMEPANQLLKLSWMLPKKKKNDIIAAENIAAFEWVLNNQVNNRSRRAVAAR